MNTVYVHSLLFLCFMVTPNDTQFQHFRGWNWAQLTKRVSGLHIRNLSHAAFWVLIPCKFPGLNRRFGERFWLTFTVDKIWLPQFGRNSVTADIDSRFLWNDGIKTKIIRWHDRKAEDHQISTEPSTLEDEMSRNVGHQSPSAAASHHRRMKTKAYTLNLPLCQGVGCDLTWMKFCKTVVITTKLSSGLLHWTDSFLWNAFISTAGLLILRNNTAHQLFTSLFRNIYEIGWFLLRYHNH